ncbi:hypothetical protein [Chromobacterium sp. LK11]|uniref:hypothetical protein n=1 Tax=Chromobacterium sp. LK11 TaxID=1628212 RepID=UPI0012E1215E|nr:hypothetical protein [Chromobacterium sp. LK11]
MINIVACLNPWRRISPKKTAFLVLIADVDLDVDDQIATLPFRLLRKCLGQLRSPHGLDGVEWLDGLARLVRLQHLDRVEFHS